MAMLSNYFLNIYVYTSRTGLCSTLILEFSFCNGQYIVSAETQPVKSAEKNILSTQPQTQHLYQPLPPRFWEYHRNVGKSQGKEGCPFSSGHNKTISLLNSEQLPAEDQTRQNSVIAGIGDLQSCPLPRRHWQLVVAGEGRTIVFGGYDH